ncbi:MAG: hypothetical protein QG552_858, partial [Thermodesulfobacteriota bacterium]|nr:hypothetical protein [Thermodesulfobacteriota bacterium]
AGSLSPAPAPVSFSIKGGEKAAKEAGLRLDE